jgi:hypothetical protein
MMTGERCPSFITGQGVVKKGIENLPARRYHILIEIDRKTHNFSIVKGKEAVSENLQPGFRT